MNLTGKAGILLAIAVILLCAAAWFLSPQLHRKDQSASGRVEARLILNASGVPELWLFPSNGGKPTKAFNLNPGDGVGSFSWSPNGKLLAFEIYDLQGHSPMTTSHVWVEKSDGTGAKEILLPAPNQIYSTHVGRWINDDQLQIRALLLRPETEVLYLFSYSTQEIDVSK